MREPHHPSREDLELSTVLHALSDPARLEIVRRLQAGSEWACGRFDLGMSKATVSHHLKVLRESGLTQTRCEGRKRLISLRREDLEDRFPGLLDAVVDGQSSKPAERLHAQVHAL